MPLHEVRPPHLVELIVVEERGVRPGAELERIEERLKLRVPAVKTRSRSFTRRGADEGPEGGFAGGSSQAIVTLSCVVLCGTLM
jgi:hypothetical protein